MRQPCAVPSPPTTALLAAALLATALLFAGVMGTPGALAADAPAVPGGPAAATGARAPAPAPTPPPDDLAAYIGGAIEFYNRLAAPPLVAPSARQIEALLDGEVVKIRRAGDPDAPLEADRHEQLTTYDLVEQPLVQVWLASLDPHLLGSTLVTEVRLADLPQGGSTWYQYIDLPWPITDRHWVIDVRKDVELAERGGGWIWKQTWDLVAGGRDTALAVVRAGRAPGITIEAAEKAVYLPVNTGAWVVFALTERQTLVVYHLTTVFGGHIPEKLVNTFAMTQLDNLMHAVEKQAASMPQHYVAGHSTIYGGDGQPIAPLAPGGGE